jgi:hypothetical protein
MTTEKIWNRDVTVTLHAEDLDYILWTLWQNVEEIRDSSFYEDADEQNVEFIQSLIDSLRSQAGFAEED